MRRSLLYLLYCLLCLRPLPSYSTPDTLSTLLPDEEVELDNGWRYKFGDNPLWSKVDFNDQDWDVFSDDSSSTYYDDTLDSYRGLAWFRKKIIVTNEMAGIPVALDVHVLNAGELWIDGKKMKSFGILGIGGKGEESGFTLKKDPLIHTFTTPGEHLIAFRLSNFLESENESRIQIGLNPGITGFDIDIHQTEAYIRELTDYSEIFIPIFYSGLFIALSVFHLILFLFYRKNIINLHYSLYTFLLFVVFFGVYSLLNGTDFAGTQRIFMLEAMAMYLSPMFSLAILYQVFYKKLLKVFWVFLSLILAGTVFFFFTDLKDLATVIFSVVMISLLIENIRVYIVAWRKKKDGSRIFIFGILLPPIGTAVLAIISNVLESTRFDSAARFIDDNLASFFGYTLLLSASISMTVYLARDFARLNKKLQQQLKEIKQLYDKTIVQERERKEILENQKLELERLVAERTSELQEKNRDITDNLRYARRIQAAILPQEKEIEKAFGKFCLIYLPKDIVSGDFYACFRHDNKLIFGVADCTGHGVTGAFMSMIGSSLLNQIIMERGITTPSRILNHLHEGLSEAIKQGETEITDGLDIALCSLDLEKNTVHFAGANRPLWLIREGTIQEIKGDKFGIGGFRSQADTSFTDHEHHLKEGDVLYLFTDGYADQFGGPDGKKMLSRRFREKLISMSDLPLEEQEKQLLNWFNNWKGNHEQIDDVLVFGIKIR